MSIKLGGNSPKKITMRAPSRLPAEYQEVEYIESSGTQYLIVGTSFKTSYKIIMDLQMTLTGGDYVPLGIRDTSNYKYGIDAWGGYFTMISGNGSWTNTLAEDTNRHTIIMDKGTATIDGTNYSINYSNYTFSGGIGVFGYNQIGLGGVGFRSSNKLYKLDIYDENGVHIYDLVPCYRKAGTVIGMYDLVNNQFYTNSGTGTFTKGNDVNLIEKEIKRVTIRPDGTEKQIRPAGWTPGANTIAYYPLTSTTTVNDMKGSGTVYNLTNNGCTFGVNAGVDSLLLNGTGNTDHILTGNMGDISAYSHTISIWAYATGITNSNGWILFRGEGNDNYKGGAEIVSRPSYIRYAYWWDDLDSIISYSTGSWHNIVAIFDKSSSKQYLYMDGQAIGNRTTTYTHSLKNNNFYVGAGYNYYNPSVVARWNGYLSELIVENKIRTKTEISDYYNSTKALYGIS